MMRVILMTLTAAAVLAMLPVNGMAADYELVGFTTATANGGTRIPGFTAACQAEFGSTTRWCNSVEVMETVNLPTLPADAVAWARPVYAPSEAGQEKDASGLMRLIVGSALACTAVNTSSYRLGPWTSTSSDDEGLVVYTDGESNFTFGRSDCSEAYQVACCGPVPEPSIATVPAIMWFGRGLLGAMVLSIAVAGLMRRRQLALQSGASPVAGIPARL